MKLDGREFHGITQQLTAVQNDYLTAYLRTAGAIELFLELGDKPNEEKVNEIRTEFITRILLSGLKSKILAGCLTEEGTTWSRASADANAARFDQITDPGEIQAMTSGLVGVVIGFFPFAGKSSPSSPSSSNQSDAVPVTESADRGTSETSPRSSVN